MGRGEAPPGGETRYRVVSELARALVGAASAGALYTALCAAVRQLFPAAACTIALYDGEAEPRPVHTEGGHGEWAWSERGLGERLRSGGVLFQGGTGEGMALVVPLRHRGALVGCLGVTGVGHPGAEEIELLQTIGDVAGLALHGAGPGGDSERGAEAIDQLTGAVRELSASLELEEVVGRVADRAHRWIGGAAVVWLMTGERAQAVAVAGGAGVRPGAVRPLPVGVEGEVLEQAARQGGEVGAFAADGGSALFEDPAWFGVTELRGGRALIPLILGPRLVGVLAVGPWREAPARERLALLRRLAPHAAAAIENARLHGEVRQLSLTDPLVHLPNRRQLDLVLEREFAAALRGRSACIILYDLDRFKEYNDRHGHQAGDDALKRFGRLLQEETRSMNLAARYGGEEFAVILSGTGRLGGRHHAERVRRRTLREFAGELTVSAGVAEVRPGMESPADLVVAADRALYRAKALGRNRICMADET